MKRRIIHSCLFLCGIATGGLQGEPQPCLPGTPALVIGPAQQGSLSAPVAYFDIPVSWERVPQRKIRRWMEPLPLAAPRAGSNLC